MACNVTTSLPLWTVALAVQWRPDGVSVIVAVGPGGIGPGTVIVAAPRCVPVFGQAVPSQFVIVTVAGDPVWTLAGESEAEYWSGPPVASVGLTKNSIAVATPNAASAITNRRWNEEPLTAAAMIVLTSPRGA